MYIGERTLLSCTPKGIIRILEDVIGRVSYITPVPKGVVLITRAMLLENTIEAYQGGA